MLAEGSGLRHIWTVPPRYRINRSTFLESSLNFDDYTEEILFVAQRFCEMVWKKTHQNTRQHFQIDRGSNDLGRGNPTRPTA